MTWREDAIRTVAEWLGATRAITAFTGAGISTESGIADFRSPGGVWSRHRPVMYDDFLNDLTERRRYWEIRRESMAQFLDAKPNDGHRALARLEQDGRLLGVITQNIDGLHQQAGSRNVQEVHGTAMTTRCLDCRETIDALATKARLEGGETELRCTECGGIMKSMTISFGEVLPREVWNASMKMARNCEVFLVAGSSLVVYPAAGLPQEAKRHGARLVLINRDATPLDDMADLVINAPIGASLSAIMAAMGYEDFTAPGWP